MFTLLPTTTASRMRVLAGSVLVALAVTACSSTAPTPAGPASSSASSAASQTASQTGGEDSSASAPAGDVLALAMADNPLGSILVDGKGMTLYLFTKDSKNASACEGDCLVKWPPLLGKPTAGAGVDDALLGSFARADGREQATYNGWPLYYWQNDKASGDTSGQNVGSVWFVLDHDGNPIK
ncbi:COG4315 family predicted lipoprotein [Aestuariimicrobium soli]|uniref:COG4315 family predicted lipoprotein n=1 Tax=Aestuariimicrobium soli TaxID=2035834 RepID=UPI003EBDB2C4